jgi:hypothetical protein
MSCNLKDYSGPRALGRGSRNNHCFERDWWKTVVWGVRFIFVSFLFVCLFFVCFHNYSKHKIGKRVMVIPNYQIIFLLVQKLYNLLFKSCLLNNSLLDNSLLFDRTQVWWFQLPILYQSCAKMIGVFASLVGQILFLVLKNFRNSGSGFSERHDPDIPKWKTFGSKTCSRKTWWLT